jgi:hypothetical protein
VPEREEKKKDLLGHVLEGTGHSARESEDVQIAAHKIFFLRKTENNVREKKNRQR